AVFLLPMIVERGRIRLRFCHNVRRGFGKAIGNVVQLVLIGLVVDQGAAGQRGGQKNGQLESPPVAVDHHGSTSRSSAAANCSFCEWPCQRSYARIGSFRGTSDALPRLRVKIRKSKAA